MSPEPHQMWHRAGRYSQCQGILRTLKAALLLQTFKPKSDRTMTADHALILGSQRVVWCLGRLEEAIALEHLGRQMIETRSRIFISNNKRTLQAIDTLGKYGASSTRPKY